MAHIVMFGSINTDLFQMVEELPRPGETSTARAATWSGGGKGANQAHAARAVSAADQIVRFVGCVGDDVQGKALLAELAGTGVSVADCAVTDGASGVAVVTVDSHGENTVVVTAGANAQWPDGFVERTLLGPGDVVVVQLEIGVAEAAQVLAHAKHSGARTILNAAPSHPDARTLLPDADVLVVNELELHDMLGVASVAEAGEVPSDLVVTLGSRGSAIRAGGEEHLVPPHPVDVVATVGARDSFVGAFAAAYAEGEDLRAAAVRGNIAGAITATVEQARHPGLSRSAVDRIAEEGRR